jgi:hypothetical protein
MNLIDIAIPLFAGILMVTSPGAFTKATGEQLQATKKKLGTWGWILIGVAVLYALLKLALP